MSTETSASNSKSGVYQKIESFATFGINTVHAKLTEVTEVAKTRFPIAAGPIDYVSETAAVGAATVLKYYDGGALLATVTLSKVSDMATDKTKAVKPIVDKLGQTYQSSLTIVESTANNAVSKVKGAVDNGKVYILNIFDRVFVFASTIIVEATQAGLPLIEKMLKKAQPQVIHLVSFLKPYALKSLSLSAPLINKATPIAEKYWGKVVTVIEGNQVWAEYLDIAMTNSKHVIESVKTYCQLDECAEDEELDFTQLKDVPSSDAGAEENSPTKIGE